jgi:hypothetical protein
MESHQNTHDELVETKQTLATVSDELENTLRELLESRQILTETGDMLVETRQRLTDTEQILKETRQKLSLFQGESTALTSCKSIKRLDEVEAALDLSLECVRRRKISLLHELNEYNHHDEQRLCVLCLKHEKNIALLPCGHVCICEPCSQHQILEECPMCRENIAGRTKVFY